MVAIIDSDKVVVTVTKSLLCCIVEEFPYRIFSHFDSSIDKNSVIRIFHRSIGNHIVKFIKLNELWQLFHRLLPSNVFVTKSKTIYNLIANRTTINQPANLFSIFFVFFFAPHKTKFSIHTHVLCIRLLYVPPKVL